MTPDLAAAWDSMCAPVRARYARDAHRNQARQLALRFLEWKVRRRARIAEGQLPVDARILAVQPDHLGGVLASTPAFRLIKESLPTCELTVLAGPWGADAAEHCPAVDRVRTCRFPAFDRSPPPSNPLSRALAKLAPYERLLSEASNLTADHYELALILVPDFWSAALTALASIPRRIGFSHPDATPFLTHAHEHAIPSIGKTAHDIPTEHVAASQLRIATQVLYLANRQPPPDLDARMSYEPTAQDRADAVRLWRAHDLDQAASVVAIHPSPGGPSKRWSAERFAIVADHLSGRLGAGVLITGGPADVDEARAIAARSTRSAVVVAGQTSFGALAALLERCRFALGTDNGAMHLATARSVPTLRLFGPTDATVWSGWTGWRDHTAAAPPTVSLTSPRPCSPCHRLDVPDLGHPYPCMSDLPVEPVIAAIEHMWQVTRDR